MLQAKNKSKTYTKGLVALGSNLSSSVGDAQKTVTVALELLRRAGLVIESQSRFFRTPAFPAGSGPDFVNAAVIVSTDMTAAGLLTCLHDVERELGRTRQKRWEARVLDLDLLAFGDLVLPDGEGFDRWQGLSLEAQMAEAPDELILPHPRMQDRAFVLVPLMDIAPDWQHPRLGLTVAEMVARLARADLDGIAPLSGDQ